MLVLAGEARPGEKWREVTWRDVKSKLVGKIGDFKKRAFSRQTEWEYLFHFTSTTDSLASCVHTCHTKHIDHRPNSQA